MGFLYGIQYMLSINISTAVYFRVTHGLWPQLFTNVLRGQYNNPQLAENKKKQQQPQTPKSMFNCLKVNLEKKVFQRNRKV